MVYLHDYVSYVYTINSDGTDPTNLTPDLVFNENPAWSPDGTKIIFRQWTSQDNEIAKMDADGSNLIALTKNFAEDESPDWQPRP